MVSNDYLTWSQIFFFFFGSQILTLGAWVRYGPGLQQTPKVAFIGHKWEVASVSKILISRTYTSKPGQEELDSPTLLSTLVTMCSCWRASSLQTAIFLLQWIWVVTALCLHGAEKAMATHSSTLAWKIPWAEEPGRLQSMGLHRVRQDWSDLPAAAAAAAYMGKCLEGALF